MTGKGLNTTYFKWRDKQGCDWLVSRSKGVTMIQWSAETRLSCGVGKAHIKAFEVGSLLPMRIACLMDVVVDSEVQNRGVGSMLIRAAMNDCERMGSLGMRGEISSVDEPHFSKLKHIYEKLGFSFVLYGSEQLNERSNTAGEIKISFDE